MSREEGVDYLYRQLVKLGDMMGDGMHHEPDGKWIEKEYRQIAQLLFPEAYKKRKARKVKADSDAIINLLKEKRCECGGEFLQKRKGSKKCYFGTCNKTYNIKLK